MYIYIYIHTYILYTYRGAKGNHIGAHGARCKHTSLEYIIAYATIVHDFIWFMERDNTVVATDGVTDDSTT